MTIGEISIGKRVKTNRGWAGVPVGTEGVIIEDYGTGIMVAWDMQDKPYPTRYSPAEVSKMYAVHPDCPLRDGFDYAEIRFLEVIK